MDVPFSPERSIPRHLEKVLWLSVWISFPLLFFNPADFEHVFEHALLFLSSWMYLSKEFAPLRITPTSLMFHAKVCVGSRSLAEMMKLGVKMMVIYMYICDLLERGSAHSITPQSTWFEGTTQIKVCWADKVNIRWLFWPWTWQCRIENQCGDLKETIHLYHPHCASWYLLY